jgi:hypothetical protein
MRCGCKYAACCHKNRWSFLWLLLYSCILHEYTSSLYKIKWICSSPPPPCTFAKNVSLFPWLMNLMGVGIRQSMYGWILFHSLKASCVHRQYIYRHQYMLSFWLCAANFAQAELKLVCFQVQIISEDSKVHETRVPGGARSGGCRSTTMSQ